MTSARVPRTRALARLAWFAGIWLASVATLGAVGLVIRSVLKG